VIAAGDHQGEGVHPERLAMISVGDEQVPRISGGGHVPDEGRPTVREIGLNCSLGIGVERHEQGSPVR